MQALYTLQQEGGLPAVAAHPAAESGSPTVPDRLLLAACDRLFALWAVRIYHHFGGGSPHRG